MVKFERQWNSRTFRSERKDNPTIDDAISRLFFSINLIKKSEMSEIIKEPGFPKRSMRMLASLKSLREPQLLKIDKWYGKGMYILISSCLTCELI